MSLTVLVLEFVKQPLQFANELCFLPGFGESSFQNRHNGFTGQFSFR